MSDRKLIFDRLKIKIMEDAELQYENVTLTPAQKKLFNLMASLFSTNIEINTIALRGFIRKALKEIQMKYQMTAEQIGELQLQEQAPIFKEGLVLLGEYIKKVLINNDQNDVIDKAISNAYQYYYRIERQRIK